MPEITPQKLNDSLPNTLIELDTCYVDKAVIELSKILTEESQD